jgi:cytoskeletal protein RodZ|tara:strand:- start:7172 stop:7552 length:381 start_codon:yes stop_codon:yes gene_type:complete
MLDNVKKKKEEIYREIGLKISSQRKRKRKKFKSISKTLNISIDYLNLIEEGKINELPQHIPVMGFVRSYARFVEADILPELNKIDLVLADKVPQKKNIFNEIKYLKEFIYFLLCFVLIVIVLFFLN